VDIQSIKWQSAIEIRHKVLWPDKPASFCKVEGDEAALHFGGFVDGQLVCVASIYVDGQTARLRKFATLVEFQGLGIGSSVITFIMEMLKNMEIKHFWCDARKTAVGFYERFGMAKQGLAFNKSGVLYYKMAVQLVY